MDNFREFDIGVRRFAEKTVPEAVRDTRDAAALEGLRSSVLLTPVDTGRLQGNWQTTVGTPAEGHDEDRKDKEGARTIAEGSATIAGARDPFDPIWLHNGVPYAAYVNNGTPKVPAVHMLERTADRLRRQFRAR